MGLDAEKRRALIAMAARRAKPGSGTEAHTLRGSRPSYGIPDVRKYLKDIRFVIAGGLATRLYMPERMTLDVDVFILGRDQERAERMLAEAGCEKTGPLTVGGSGWRLDEGGTLDLIALGEPWVEEAIDSAVTGPDGQPYADLPHLVLMKLGSGRMQDLADVSRMLGGAREADVNAVRRLVKRFRPADREDLESLISLGRLEHEQAG